MKMKKPADYATGIKISLSDLELLFFVGLVDFGLVDFGLVDFGLVDFGLVDFGLVDFGLIALGIVRPDHRVSSPKAIGGGVAIDFPVCAPNLPFFACGKFSTARGRDSANRPPHSRTLLQNNIEW